MKHVTLPIVVEADADGYFVSCPALQSCYSQGESYEEAVTNIKDAIRLHVEDPPTEKKFPSMYRSACRWSKSPSDDQARV